MLSEDLRSKDAEYASELRDDEANIHKFTAALQTCENDLLRRTRGEHSSSMGQAEPLGPSTAS